MVEIIGLGVLIALVSVVGYGMVTGGISSLRNPPEYLTDSHKEQP